MRLPKTIQVGPFVYTVVENYIFKENRSLWGQCDSTALELRFSVSNQGTTAPESKRAEVQIHELLHAVVEAYLPGSLGLSEEQVDMLAKGLLDTVRRNGINLLDTETAPDPAEE